VPVLVALDFCGRHDLRVTMARVTYRDPLGEIEETSAVSIPDLGIERPFDEQRCSPKRRRKEPLPDGVSAVQHYSQARSPQVPGRIRCWSRRRISSPSTHRFHLLREQRRDQRDAR
jgi:hypothetical protein